MDGWDTVCLCLLVQPVANEDARVLVFLICNQHPVPSSSFLRQHLSNLHSEAVLLFFFWKHFLITFYKMYKFNEVPTHSTNMAYPI